MTDLITLLQEKTDLKPNQIFNILHLLNEGCTIPFIARYRKDATEGADDETLRVFEEAYLQAKNLLDRKEEIVRLIQERAILTSEIKQNIQTARSLRELEDIYRPYKEKKNSRAATAIENGLTPLANILQSAKMPLREFCIEAKKYLSKNITSIDDAIGGACDIVAERFSDFPKQRDAIRQVMLRHGVLEVKKTKTFNEQGVYANFINHSEKIAYIPSHRYLAIMRGVQEKELSAKISIDLVRVEENIKHYVIPKNASDLKDLLFDAYKDGLKRLLLPSIEREVHSELKQKADIAAINLFGKNLHQLLMTPPVANRVILGVDPAFKTGCKLAVIDENGIYQDSAVIYPTQPHNDYQNSKAIITSLVAKHQINCVAIGNGTASRETQEFFARLNNEEGMNLSYTVVSEAGASVYSASKLASLEYPNLDVTIRGAISIAQRLRDPMATLVKIDPKSLGIGQYQHDVDQKLLGKKLFDVTVDIVNKVGVDINSASLSLLAHISGLNSKVAQNILAYKAHKGSFTTKSELLQVKGLGAKTYEQAAGFIRIKNGKNIFDNSGIHPESYDVAEKLQGLDLTQIDIKQKAQELGIGIQTLTDIIHELLKPGFDPREELPAIAFKEDITDIAMLQIGSYVSGVVRNIADFGAFVDIGLKNDGMIHISKMSKQRIAHPLEVLSINQFLPQIEVVSIDRERGKVGLSLA